VLSELPATPAGVVITIGITALLATATGATVKIAGNELGAKDLTARTLTGLLGVALVAWSAWSLREQPFEVTSIDGSRLELLKANHRNCAAEIEIAVFVRFHRAPGTIRYEVRLGAGVPVETFSQQIDHTGAGTDLLGPQRIHVPSGHHYGRLSVEAVIVAPNLLHTDNIRLIGPTYPTLQVTPARARLKKCGLY
jgi:hypothetical protein